MIEFLEKPSVLDFGKAIAVLSSAPSNSEVPPQGYDVSTSSLRSLQKLDGLLDRISNASAWNAQKLSVTSENGKVGFRRPKVVVHFAYDRFPARSGNLELWLNPEPGFERDFKYNIQKTKLLRVDRFWQACGEQVVGGCDYISPTREGAEVVISAAILFRRIIQGISDVCEVRELNSLKMVVDRSTRFLSSFNVTEIEGNLDGEQ